MRFFRRWCDEDYDGCWSSILLSVAVLCLVSLLMLWLGDRINGQNLALTRYMARAQAPLAAHFHPDAARRQISVILYDDEFLEADGHAWPIPYGTHADWIDRLSSEPDATPRAIFLDISFGQARHDDSLDTLIETLCRVRHGKGIPIYLAGLSSPHAGGPVVRRELMSARAENGEPCVALVGVDDAADPLDGIAWTYPLSWHQDARGLFVPGPGADAGRPGHPSAARLIAEQAGIDPGPETAPMALVWGPSLAMIHPSTFWRGCSSGESLRRLLVPGVLRQLWEEAPAAPACPTHPTLSMSQVNQLEDRELAPYLKDTFVFIGARVSGYDDYALSPVQGRLPGVYVHAMALDNLLVYGNAYKQQGAWGLPPSRGLLGAGLAAVASVFAAHVLFRRVLRAWSRRMGLEPSPPGRDAGLPERLLGLLLRSVGWLLRVWLQLIMALFMIVLLQQVFRIGMLPLIELIGMTLLAEGLGYLNAVRRFFATGQAAGDAPRASGEPRAGTAPSLPHPVQEKA